KPQYQIYSSINKNTGADSEASTETMSMKHFYCDQPFIPNICVHVNIAIVCAQFKSQGIPDILTRLECKDRRMDNLTT
uniref:Uncharacterized protein n=1 Tax=Mola mola TaxID=94237 RepID=A0A3Q3WHZ2_MOLML